jgi:hypothetical protein
VAGHEQVERRRAAKKRTTVQLIGERRVTSTRAGRVGGVSVAFREQPLNSPAGPSVSLTPRGHARRAVDFTTRSMVET